MHMKTLAALAATTALALGATACGGSDDDSSTRDNGTTTAGQARVDAGGRDPGADRQGHGRHARRRLRRRRSGTLKLTPGAGRHREISKAGVASFPITGGNVTYYTPGTESPYVQGMIDHDGSGPQPDRRRQDGRADRLRGRPRQVRADRQGHRRRRGRRRERAAVLPRRPHAEAAARPATTAPPILEGTTVKLKQEAADLLNQTFGVDALTGGFVIGVAKITVNTAYRGARSPGRVLPSYGGRTAATTGRARSARSASTSARRSPTWSMTALAFCACSARAGGSPPSTSSPPRCCASRAPARR